MEVNANLINSILQHYQVDRYKAIDLFKRSQCRVDGVPILERVYTIAGVEQTAKINNKLNNDFFNEIINTKTGYFSGVPITMNIPRENYSDAEYAAIMDEVRDFNNVNNMDYLNSESTRFTSISGYSGRLLFIDDNGEIGLFNIPGYQCFFIGANADVPDYAMRVYPVLQIQPDSRIAYVMHCDVYDKKLIYKFASNPVNTTNLSLINLTACEWTLQPDGIKEHLFSDIPLFKFKNNVDEKGDAEFVLPLIDAYDRVISDLDNEIEQQRLAYMVFKGCRPDQDTVDAAVRTGAFGFDDTSATVEFLTKNMDATAIFETLKKLQDNILHFSATPNFRDEAFSGNLSGVALDFKMRAFENKCITSERFFEATLRYQWRLILNVWALQGKPVFDWYDCDFVFTRNYPKNTLEESQTTMNLKGLVSEQTRLSLLSFVRDPYTEEKAMEEDNENQISLTNIRNSMEQNNGLQTQTTEEKVIEDDSEDDSK